MPRLRALAHLAALTLLSLPAATPWLSGDIPRTNDALTHLYRALELVRLWGDGVYFPHWGPDLAHGYGYPIYNYFPYLSHSLIGIIHVLGLPMLSAMRAAFVLAILSSGWAAFLLGRDLFGERAGLIAGLVYVYSPYLLYTAHVRGGLPENLVMVFLPLTLWAIRRAARGDSDYAVIVALTFGGAVSSHLGVTAQAAPFVAAYGFIHAVWSSKRRPGVALRRSALVALALLLGLALPAVQWIPALSELKYVQFEKGFSSAGIAYFRNFQTSGELFALPRLPADLDLLNPPLAHPISFVALALAAIALWRWRAFARDRQIEVFFWACVSLLSILLTLEVSRPVWDAIPPLQRTLWPWRYLGPGSLALALLAGSVFAGTSFPISIPVSLLLFLAGYPWLFPPREPAPESPALADLARWEIPPLLVGTTTTGEYTPVWVEAWPDTSAQQARLMAGETLLDKLDLSNVPGGEFYHTVHNARYDQYLITVPVAATVRLRRFYFPGYTLRIDNQPTPIVPTPEGLISFELPPGQHSVILEFKRTPARHLGDAVSLLALWSVTVVGAWRFGSPLGRPLRAARDWLRRLGRFLETGYFERGATTIVPAAGRSDVDPPTHLWPMLITGALMLIFKVGLLDAGVGPLVRHGLRDDPPARVQHPLALEFGGEVRLLGYDLAPAEIAADETALVNLYWQAVRPIGVPYGFEIRLVDEAGRIWNTAGTSRPRNWRFTPGTDFWPSDEYILDPYLITPIPGTPPGSYTLQAIVYRASDLQAVDAQIIGGLTVTAPTRISAAAAEAEFGGVALLEAGLDRAAAAPGEPLGISLLWTATRPLDRDLRAEIHLLDPRGQIVHRRGFPISPSYPTSQWSPGEALRDQAVMWLPAGLASGDYSVQVQALDPALGLMGAPHRLGDVRVTAPERTFTAPAFETPVNADLGGLVTLLGYDLGETPNFKSQTPNSELQTPTLTLTLYWQSRAEMQIGYHVFLHLTDAAGNIVAQSDGVPANQTRPTTGWLPGEVVADVRVLPLPADLPPGEYRLFAGMYDPASGERLDAPGFSQGAVALGAIHLAP